MSTEFHVPDEINESHGNRTTSPAEEDRAGKENLSRYLRIAFEIAVEVDGQTKEHD